MCSLCDHEHHASEYEYLLGLLLTGKIRLILNSKRKRKLKKRGERVQWSPAFGGWIWYPADKSASR